MEMIFRSATNVKQQVKFFVLWITNKIPMSTLRILSKFANLSLGKGFGATTLQLEVETVAIFSRKMKINIQNIFDVGANVGLYSEELRKEFPYAKITAFEPGSLASAKFKKRFQEDKSIQLVQAAVGSENGKSILYYDYEGSGMASMSNRKLGHFGIEFKLSEEINVITLDSFLKIEPFIPDFLKIDVEGYELAVLRGAGDSLLKIKLVQFEFGGCNIDTRTFFQDFYYLFTDAQFELFRMAPRGLVRISKYSEADEHFETTNYLAVNSRFSNLN